MDFHRIHTHKYPRGGKVLKTFLLGFCIFALVLFRVFCLFRVFLYRNFYIINEVEFTVWKTSNGCCYITPYKYWGVLPPKDNYLRISNIGSADIFICKGKTLCVFIDPHSDCATDAICKLKSCRYYSYSATGDEEELKGCIDFEEEWEKYQSIYPYLAIDARYRQIEIITPVRDKK